MLVRRFGRPGLLGAMARTAVIAGTASATVNAVNRRAAARAQEQQDAERYEAAQLQDRLAAAGAGAVDPVEEPAADAGLGDQLAKLARLHSEGALSDSEFAAAKQQLLG